jgi:hypothetical protein
MLTAAHAVYIKIEDPTTIKNFSYFLLLVKKQMTTLLQNKSGETLKISRD